MGNFDKMLKAFQCICVVVLLVCCFSISVQAEEWTTVETDISVIKGATRMVEMETTSVDDKKVSVKKVASIKIKDYCVKIKGLKKGKTTVTFSIPEIQKKYIIHVNVLSKFKVQKKAKQALKQYLKKRSKGTRYTYADLNKDGIDELVLKKKIMYYNYETGKIGMQKHNFSSIYTCKKNNTIYGVLKKQRKTKEFLYISEFYKPNLYEVFQLEGTGTGFRKYTDKGKKVYAVTENYAYYDYSYDQDDYEYDAFSKSEMWKRISKKMTGYKKIVMKKK